MPRPAKFNADQILNAAAELVAAGGPSAATMSAIAERLGAPTGSLYYRFASRELLLAHLWVRTAGKAQAGFGEKLAHDDICLAATEAALHTPRWARDNLGDARLMLLHRREDIVRRWPGELGEELERLRADLDAAVRRFTNRLCAGRPTRRDRQAVVFALVDVPYAAARRYLLAGKPPPKLVDELVRRTAECVLFDHASRSGG